MASFTHCIMVLMMVCIYTNGVWSSNIHKQGYYRLETPASSEEESNIGFKSNNAQYYNSREAHGDNLDIVDGTNMTGHPFTDSNENSNEEVPGSIAIHIEGFINKSEVNKYPYPLRIGSHDSHEISKYNQDTIRINLDISDYLEALSDTKVAANEYTEPHNNIQNYGQAQPGVIFAEHRYTMPLSNSHMLDVDSIESKEDLTSNVNTKSVYEQNFGIVSKEESSQEIFEIYSRDRDSVKSVELTSAESSETTESWAVLTQGQTRIRPGVQQDFNSTEVSLPICSGSNKGNKANQCKKDQNLCRSTGDCRIARIWGTCCNSPGCGTYCKPNRSKCPHPNSINVSCNTESDETCSQLKDDCVRGKSCCQTPCGYRCV